jgi:DNA-binding beta-propeller fold protein YncE
LWMNYQPERGVNMSHDHLSDSLGQVDLLPAELEAIDERVATDALLWERRLPATDRLDAFIRSLSQETAAGPIVEATDDALDQLDDDTYTESPQRSVPHRPLQMQPRERVSALSAFLAGVAAVAIVALFATLLLSRSGEQGFPPVPTATPTATLTPTATPLPTAGTIAATISGIGPLRGSFPYYGIAADDTAVWVHNGDDGTLLRIDPRTNRIVATIPVGRGQGGVAIGQGAVWVANPKDGTVSRVNPQTNTVVATVALAGKSATNVSLAASPGAVWATDNDNDALARIDPKTNKVIATIPNQIGASDVAYGASSTWSCDRGDSKGLTRLNPQTNQVETQIDVSMNLGFTCAAVVALTQAVWTVDLILGDGSTVHLERLDPATNTTIATISVPDTDAYHFAADEEGVWVWGPDEGLLRIDPQTNQIVGSVPMQGGAGVALGAGSVWFANATDGSLLRITPAP